MLLSPGTILAQEKEPATADTSTEEQAAQEPAADEKTSEAEPVEAEPTDPEVAAPEAEGKAPATPAAAEGEEPAQGPLVAQAAKTAKDDKAKDAPSAKLTTTAKDKKPDDKKKKMGDQDDNTAALGAAAPTPPPSPYQLFFTVGMQLGSGTFVDADRELFGYSLSFAGLYRLSKFLDGRLDVFGTLNADQALTESSLTDLGSVGSREFFFRDVRLGVLGRSIINSKSTGLIVGGNTSISLPTSVQAQAQGRYLRWALSGNVIRIFREVGPGNLLVRASLNVSRDFSDTNTVNDTDSALCSSVNTNDAGECLSSRRPFTWALTPAFSMTYLLGKFNINLNLSFINTWQTDQSNSTLSNGSQSNPGLSDDDVTSSQFATDSAPYELLTSAGLSVTYIANQNWNFTLGLSTTQLAVTRCDQESTDVSENSGQCFNFPFWDFNTPANNLSQVFFNTTFMY